MVRGKSLEFPGLRRLQLTAEQADGTQAASADTGSGEEAISTSDTRVIADKLPVTLSKDGAGKVTDKVPKVKARASAARPPTLDPRRRSADHCRSTQTLWPASVIAGIKTEGFTAR